MSTKEINSQLNQIEEIEESNENKDKIISELKEKINLLEKANNDLKTKVDSFTKKQSLTSMLFVRMAAAGFKRKLLLSKNDSIRVAEIMKEKDELQQINEKMLDMLTEKELENDELNEKLENYKLEMKTENEKNLEQIKILEEKIEDLENSKDEEQFEDIINEYNNQKEKLKEQINEYMKSEEELNNQIETKDNKIKQLNEEIQNLQFENLRLLNKSDLQKEINQAGLIDLEKLTEENNKYKSKIEMLNNDLNKRNKEITNFEQDK